MPDDLKALIHLMSKMNYLKKITGCTGKHANRILIEY